MRVYAISNIILSRCLLLLAPMVSPKRFSQEFNPELFAVDD